MKRIQQHDSGDFGYFFALSPCSLSPLLPDTAVESLPTPEEELQCAPPQWQQSYPRYLFVLNEQGCLGTSGTLEILDTPHGSEIPASADHFADLLRQLPCLPSVSSPVLPREPLDSQQSWDYPAERWGELPEFQLFAFVSCQNQVRDLRDLADLAQCGKSGILDIALCLFADRSRLQASAAGRDLLDLLGLSYWLPFRKVFAVCLDWQQGLLARAKELAYFDREFRFCSSCTAQLEWLSLEFGKHCPDCGALVFPRQDPSVIALICSRAVDFPNCGEQARPAEWLLLAHNYRFRSQMYSLIAGFVDAGEDLEQALRREAWEEAGIHLDELRYLRSQAWPQMHSLMSGLWGSSGTAPAHSRPDGKEIADLLWLERSDIQRYLRLPPCDHAEHKCTTQNSGELRRVHGKSGEGQGGTPNAFLDVPLYPLSQCLAPYVHRSSDGSEETAFCLPGKGSLARKLIEQWAWAAPDDF